MDNEVFKRAGEGAGVLAAIAYSLTLIFAKRRQASGEVKNDSEREADRLIEMLEKQRDSLEVKVDTLIEAQAEQGEKLDKLTLAFEAYACPNAPTCPNRPANADRLVNIYEFVTS